MRMTGSGVPSMKAPGRVCRRAPGERFSSAHQPAVQGRPARGVWRAGCMMRSHASRSRGSHAPAAPCCRFRLAEIGACRAIHCVPPPIRSRPSVSCRGADWAGAPAMCRAAASRCRIGRVTMVAHAGPRPRRQPPCRYASLRLAASVAGNAEWPLFVKSGRQTREAHGGRTGRRFRFETKGCRSAIARQPRLTGEIYFGSTAAISTAAARCPRGRCVRRARS